MRKFVKVLVSLWFCLGLEFARAAPDRDRAHIPTLSKAGWVRDRTLDVAASAHLRDIERAPERAQTSAVLALLRRMGEAPSRLRPLAVLGSPGEARRERMDRLLTGLAGGNGFTHYGLASSPRGLVVLLVRRVIALQPLPRPRNGELLARGRAPPEAQLSAWILGPCPSSNTPECVAPSRAVPVESSRDGFLTRFPVGRAGVWTLELVADVGLGPEVALLRQIVIAPTSENRRSVGTSASDRQDSDTLTTKLRRFRDAHERPELALEPTLRRAAEAHARGVCKLGWAVHRPPGGSAPEERTRAAGFRGRVVESVAVASNLGRAWANLLHSPAHRNGLLDPTATDFGFAVHRERSQTCLVVLLGRPRRR